MTASTAPFPIDRRRTSIAIAFENNQLIADRVMPRVPTPGERFTWKKYRPGETYKLQDTTVGRTGKPNEVEFGFDEYEAMTTDQGLEAPIPQKDIDNAPPGFDPVDNATRLTSNRVLLRREKRVADLVFNAANYSATTTLTSGQRFTNYTIDPGTPANESNPIDVISTALRTMIRRANTMVISEDGFDILARHPKIVAAYHGNEGRDGVATEEFIKRLFRIQEIIVGAAWVDSTDDTAEDNRSISGLTRLWGDDLALIYKDPSANLSEGVTWGFTAQWKTRFTRVMYDQNIGLEGGQRVRVGEHVKELVVASEYGHLLVNAFAAVS